MHVCVCVQDALEYCILDGTSITLVILLYCRRIFFVFLQRTTTSNSVLSYFLEQKYCGWREKDEDDDHDGQKNWTVFD